VDFKNTLLIMTVERRQPAPRAHQRGGARRDAAPLPPEFLNRVDEIIVFQSLSQAQLEQIVEIQLNRLRARLASGA